MPIDAPDYTTWVQRVEIIGTAQVPEQATTEDPITRIGDVTTSSATYQSLLSYTVPASKVTVLYGLELYSTVFPKALFRVTIKGSINWTDQELPTGLNIFFSDARLRAGDVVLVEVKSSDGTQVRAFAHLEGKEVS